jgi:hypothetical protein
VFRYAKNGGTLLVAGDAIQSPAQVADHKDLAPAAAAIGDTSVTVTLGATEATANQYAGGYLITRSTPGQGYAYRIASHPAADASASLVVTLDKSDAVQVALTTSSRVDLVQNPYSGVIQMPATTLTGVIVGVAVYPLVASEFGWLQTHGVAPAQIDGTPGVGNAISGPSTAAGAFAINSGTLDVVGKIFATGADGDNQAVFLTID